MEVKSADSIIERYERFFESYLRDKDITFKQFIDIIAFHLSGSYIDIEGIMEEINNNRDVLSYHELVIVDSHTERVLNKMAKLSDISKLLTCDYIPIHKEYGVIKYPVSALCYASNGLETDKTLNMLKNMSKTEEADTIQEIEKRLHNRIIISNDIRTSFVRDPASSIDFEDRFKLNDALEYISTVMLGVELELVRDISISRLNQIAEQVLNQLQVDKDIYYVQLSDIIRFNAMDDSGIGYFTLFSLFDTDFKDRNQWPFKGTISEFICNKLDKFKLDSNIWKKLKLLGTGYQDQYIQLNYNRTALLSVLYHLAEYQINNR